MKHRIALFIALVVRQYTAEAWRSPSKANTNRAALMGGILRTTATAMCSAE